MLQMSPKRITIDDLAEMVQRGFEEINEKMATKSDLIDLERRMDEKMLSKEDAKIFATKEDLGNMEERLKDEIYSVEEKLTHRIDKLEDSLLVVKTGIGKR